LQSPNRLPLNPRVQESHLKCPLALSRQDKNGSAPKKTSVQEHTPITPTTNPFLGESQTIAIQSLVSQHQITGFTGSGRPDTRTTLDLTGLRPIQNQHCSLSTTPRPNGKYPPPTPCHTPRELVFSHNRDDSSVRIYCTVSMDVHLTAPNKSILSSPLSITLQTYLLSLPLSYLQTADSISHEEFMKRVSSIFKGRSPPMNPPLFIFKKCKFAASHNARILERYNFDLERIIRSQHPSQISFGSEFRDSSILETLLIEHPLWPCLKNILNNGAAFPLESLSPESRLSDLKFHRD
jgi:hypothetical protein